MQNTFTYLKDSVQEERLFFGLFFVSQTLGIAIFGYVCFFLPKPLHAFDRSMLQFFPSEAEREVIWEPNQFKEESEPEELIFSEHLRIQAQKEEGIQHDEAAKPYHWLSYESMNMLQVFEQVEQGREPNSSLLAEAYLDMDRKGYQRYFQLSEMEIEEAQRDQEQKIQALFKRNVPKKRENAIEFVQRIIASIHEPAGLRYQADLNTVTSYFTQNKIQCQSATYLTALIWYQHAHHYPDAELVFVNTPGHVKPGLVIDKKMYSLEALKARPLAIPDSPSVDPSIIVTRGKEELIDLMYTAAERSSPYKESDIVLFRRGEVIDPIMSKTAQAMPLPTVGLAQEEELDFAAMLESDEMFSLNDLSWTTSRGSSSGSSFDALFSSLDISLEPGSGGLSTVSLVRSSSPVLHSPKRTSQEVLSTGQPLILGGLDRSLIDAVIRKNLSQIRYCYQRALSRQPNIEGKVVVKFVIARDGSVSKSTIKSSSLGSQAVESCIVGRFRRFQFPKPSGGIVIVSYPFSFSNSLLQI